MSPRTERLARYRHARERVLPRISLKAFERLVAAAIDDLPPFVRQRMDNVAVVVEEWAEPDRLARLGFDADQDLLGLYEGVNRLERGGSYHLATPDRITLLPGDSRRRARRD